MVNSTGLETNFSELKDPAAFLDDIKKALNIGQRSTK